MDNHGFIYLRISGIGLQLDEITNCLGVIPEISYHAGESRYDKRIKNRKITYQEDCWLFGKEIGVCEDISVELERFAELFSDSADYLASLAKTYAVTFWLSLYPETAQTHFCLSQRTVSLFAQMKAGFNCSASYLEEFYAGRI